MDQSLWRSRHHLPISPVFSFKKYLSTLERLWPRQNLIKMCLLWISIAICASERGTFLKGIGATNKLWLMKESNRIDIAKKSATNQANMRLGFPIKLKCIPAFSDNSLISSIEESNKPKSSTCDIWGLNMSASQVLPWRLEVSQEHKGGGRGVAVA